MSDPVARLILELSKLPGIGEKSATRLTYFLLKTDVEAVHSLANAMLHAKENIQFCQRCFTFTDIQPCRLCNDERRRAEFLCVIEKPSDLLAIENSQRFHGRYHVLHGVLSPLEGVGPEQLRIRELVARVGEDQIQEVILALNPTIEGETTGVYLTKLLRPLGVRVSKIAHGIPVGGVLEYIDRQTIGRAIENRMTTT